MELAKVLRSVRCEWWYGTVCHERETRPETYLLIFSLAIRPLPRPLPRPKPYPRPVKRPGKPSRRPWKRPGKRPGRGRRRLVYLGRFKAVPRLGRPLKIFRSKAFARIKCIRLARRMGYRVIALRHGRLCYATKRSHRKFTYRGRTRKRLPGTLRVYFIKGWSLDSNSLVLVGCLVLSDLDTLFKHDGYSSIAGGVASPCPCSRNNRMMWVVYIGQRTLSPIPSRRTLYGALHAQITAAILDVSAPCTGLALPQRSCRSINLPGYGGLELDALWRRIVAQILSVLWRLVNR